MQHIEWKGAAVDSIYSRLGSKTREIVRRSCIIPWARPVHEEKEGWERTTESKGDDRGKVTRESIRYNERHAREEQERRETMRV